MMKLKKILVAIVLGVVCACQGQQGDVQAAEKEYLASAGCKTEHFLLVDLAEAYQQKTGKTIRIASTGNKKAIDLMLDNKIDFAYTCKPIISLSKKLKLDASKISTWKSVPIAKDPIAIVSNKKNGVSDISVAQLTALFEGKIKNWQEIGGTDLPVLTAYINPELESGTVLLFKEFTVGMDGKLDPGAKQLNGPSMLGNYVAATPGGVTFIPLNAYDEKFGDIVKIDGVEPVKENILNGKYSLSATYYLTFDQSDNKDLADFVEYCLSAAGQGVVAKNFIPYSQ
ncbi:MAG: substrate-binding domain-containing protein [Proteobacteria bacterium]|nr:substrate-binding domain-containing protein [Pseudomonadota bacterium]